MANTITSVNDDIISQTVLEAFVGYLAPLRAFTTSFNSDAAKAGEKVSFLYTSAATAAALKVTQTAYTVQDSTQLANEISLGQPYYVSWTLEDVEIASSSVLNMETWAVQKGYQLAYSVFRGILASVTNANYGAAVFTGVASGFDLDDIADLRDDASAASMPLEPRALVLDSSYCTNMLKQNAIIDASAYGDTRPIREGTVGRIFGMDVYESNIIPENGEFLKGFLAHPSGLAVAMRYLKPQDGNTYFRAEPLTDPSGITIGLRDWYDNSYGRRIKLVECVYGAAVGISAGIKRITSA